MHPGHLALSLLLAGACSSLLAQTTVTFRDGAAGYAGTQDTYVRAANADTTHGSNAALSVDGDDGDPGLQPNHGLIRFDGIIGPGGIPAGSAITSAALTVTVTNPGSGMTIHRILADWSEASTWNSLGGGIQANDTDAQSAAQSSVGANDGNENILNGNLVIPVTGAVQAWADGSPNYGLALLPFASGTNGIDFPSRESTTPAQRPILSVTYVPPGTPPAVELTSPTEGTIHQSSAVVLLSASASDADGSITLVEFFANGVAIGEDANAPYEFAWQSNQSGSYTLAAKATDNLGVSTNSTPVSITVTNADNTAPTSDITSPADGTVTSLTSHLIMVEAVDPDGLVVKVEFYDGPTKLGSDTSPPFTFQWSNASLGDHRLTAVATDNDLGTTTSDPVAVTVTAPVLTTVIPKLSTWRYLDSGSDQGTAWKEPAFDDSAWNSGPAILGGGDPHINTNINIGPSGARHITSFFRKSFALADSSEIEEMTLNILRDDGVVLYINGTEVARQNMPPGPVTFSTAASASVNGIEETTYFPSSASPLSPLVDGVNVVAVEVHQQDANSSDLGFDLELVARKPSDDLPPAAAAVTPDRDAIVPIPSVTLGTHVADPENGALTVTFYGREKGPDAGSDFTLVTLPDTQYYSQNSGGNRFSQFLDQTNWIVAAKDALNIAFVAHMGDMAQSYDTVAAEYIRADQAMDIIEDPASTLLTHGIPWGGAPGNHDIGQSTGTTALWNQYFGTARWAGRPYFAGNYGANNDNNYQLFNASGLEFIIVNLAYSSSTTGKQAVLDWADAILKAHPNRRAIITSHFLISTGNPGPWGTYGQFIYENLKDNPNLFLMLCGHIHGEGQRSDTFEGRTVHTVLQDYQDFSGSPGGFGGGDGWLRYFIFSPTTNTITAKTYRPFSDTFKTDANSEFTLPYDMLASAPWVELGTVTVPSGSTATVEWTGLVDGVKYEWYAAASDGASAVSTVPRTFTASATALPLVTITSDDNTAGEFGADQSLHFTVARSSANSSPLEVHLTAEGSAVPDLDYTGFASVISIPASQASAGISLHVSADNEAEGPETAILLVASDVIGTDYAVGDPDTATATVEDKPSQKFYYFNIADPAKRGAAMNADGDSDENLMEYYRGTDPDDPGSRDALLFTATETGNFHVRHTRAKNVLDVAPTLQWSPGLPGAWLSGGESINGVTVAFSEEVVSPPDDDPETVEVTVSITGTTDRLFLRLVVEE